MALPINIEDLLNRQRIEGNRIEFKRGWNPAKIYQTICAFANDFDNIGGGYILVGVEEDHGRARRPVVGIPEEKLDGIQQSMVGFNNKIKPYYMPRTSVEAVDGKYVLAIWVPSGSYRPYEVLEDVLSSKSKSRWYIRSGSSTIEAKGEVLDELREMANRVPFDERGNEQIAIDDLSPVLVLDYLRRVKSRLTADFTGRTLEQVLEQLDLYEGPREQRRLKNVAAMMFSEEPHRFFPYTRVEIVLFPEGTVRNPNNFMEAPTITGSVPTMIRATLDYLRLMVIKERIRKVPYAAEAIRHFNYPYQAIEEAVVNALYHRDYQQREPVEISVEPHAISILSYAGPDRSITKEAIEQAHLLRARRYRNRRLGDFLKELDFSEGRATGIPTIQEELRNNGSPPATIETDDDRSYFLIIIPCHPDFLHDGVLNDPDKFKGRIKRGGRISDTINGTINDDEDINDSRNDSRNDSKKTISKQSRQDRLMRIIQTQPHISSRELASLLGVSYPTIWRDLSELTERGIIRYEGAKKTGRWVILNQADEGME